MKEYCYAFLLVGLLQIPLQQIAQAQSATSQAQPVVMLNHIALYVNNLEKSNEFYEEVMDLKKIEEPFHDGLHAWFSIGEHSQLHLIEGAREITEHDKQSHLCFSVPSVEDFIKTLDKHNLDYTNWAGDSKSPTVRVDGVKQIYLKDPDGYWVEINDDTPYK